MDEMKATLYLKRFFSSGEMPPIRDVFQMCAAEIVGTGILMLFGCMGGLTESITPVLVGAFSFGMIVMLIITAFGHISQAHLNPAVSICAVLLGELSPIMLPLYIVSQVIGAIMGYSILWIVVPEKFHEELCVTQLVEKFSWWQGFTIEFLATTVLILVCCGIWEARSGAGATLEDSAELKLGLTITSLILISGPYTGCSMNPARSFAPAVYNQMWRYHSIYWLGPCLAGVLATYLYMMLYGRPHKIRDEDTTLRNIGSTEYISIREFS